MAIPRIFVALHGITATPVVPRMTRLFLQNAFIQIQPIRICTLYQLVFSFSVPALDLFFPLNSGSNISCFFKVYQLVDTISGSKAVGVDVVLVFKHSPDQLIGHSNVYGRIGYIGKNIHIVRHASVNSLP